MRRSASRSLIQQIEKSVGDQLDNARITADIKSALLTLEPASALRVNVDTSRGIVYLRGEVVSADQKAEAERVVREACPRGVRRIVNELRINPDLPPFPSP